MKQYYEDNPDAREHQREMSIKQWEDPNARERMSEIKKQHYVDNPNAREQMSEIKKQHYVDNPNAGKEYGERIKKYYEDNPDARERMSEIKKRHYVDNPNAGKEYGERMKKYFENPESKRRIADIKGNNKPFDVFTRDGTFIKTFTYQFEAIEYLRKEHHITSTIQISNVLTGKQGKSAGFVFKYK